MISKNHPRVQSLTIREQITAGVANGITSPNGLIAHGRGEAFDYLIGEKTQKFAKKAIAATAILLSKAKYPVLSINGNVAALCPEECVALSSRLSCPIEVNLFHRNTAREKNIEKLLTNLGAKSVVGAGSDASVELPSISSERRFVSPRGIFQSDVVLVPLEDGDKCEVLIKAGKKVITIDLNPLSRTAQMATVTIVDNITRSLPLLIKQVKNLQKGKTLKLEGTQLNYDNKQILSESISCICSRLQHLAETGETILRM